MNGIDITILTDQRWVNPKSPDWYSDQVIKEDQLLSEALERLGLTVHRTNWDNPNFDWANTRYALFRTVWDYSERWNEFDSWFKQTEKITQFINPAGQIRWNLDKHYLRDLNEAGVNIPATVFIERGSGRTLTSIFDETGWNEAVLKPTISGGGRETYRMTREQVSKYEDKLSERLAIEDMMLQEFQQNVVERGEVSMMFAGSHITHSIIKTAKAGDFRVQDDFGGTVQDYNPSENELIFAKNVLSACKKAPILGRVDMVWDNKGIPALGELEIIEPEMWFRFCPDAANSVANVVYDSFFR